MAGLGVARHGNHRKEPPVKQIEVTIRGVTPLILNRFTDEAAEAATKGTRRATKSSESKTPRKDAESRLYKNDKGKLVIPAGNILSMLIEAGRQIKVGRSKLSTMKSSLVPAWILFSDTEFPLKHEQPWSVDSRPVVNPPTGGRLLRYRPRFDEWSVTMRFEINDSMDLGGDSLARELFDVAGSVVGLGDFRPSRRGPFGRWRVDHWEIL
jgi:hypothetical protein